MKGVTHMGGWTDVLKKKQWQLLSWKSRNFFTSWSITPCPNGELDFTFGQRQAWFPAFGSGSGRVMPQSRATAYVMAILIHRFSHAVRWAGALCRLCVRSAHLRGLWWEIEHDQHAQENPWTKMVPGSDAAHPSKPSIQGRELLSLQSKLGGQALLLVEDLALSKPG